ncbi:MULTISPECIES: TetR/AcrR family transcriptional regulator C-terminal domain-containing protein [unclassified Rhodococcus (in: high G+C Gram-positive bacteria)]|uniref:TetR/AcrR family transcriptional regulator n=1 Tax=Rhodococcus sp. SJ-3 TaxID=3454628 RepID=UPI003F790B5A
MAKRARLERGSLNPDDILRGAFELAEEVTVDNLSMPMLARHLDIGVTSIYWYFRKKDELLTAMADHVLRESTRSMPVVEAANWRDTLRTHARTVRRTFLDSPILCDLVLIRPSLSSNAARLGARHNESVITGLVESGFTLADAVNIYSSVQLHVHGMVVLQRLQDKNRQSQEPSGAYYEILSISAETTPLLAEASENGLQSGEPNDRNFEYGLECILDHAAHALRMPDHQDAIHAGAER